MVMRAGATNSSDTNSIGRTTARTTVTTPLSSTPTNIETKLGKSEPHIVCIHVQNNSELHIHVHI